jgi:hypothetical protein
MMRVLIVALAALVGALGTWFLVPTSQMSSIGSETPMLARTSAPRNPVLSAEMSRERAERLIGDDLRYMDTVHSTSWFNEQGEQAIERAMDECFLVTEPELYLQHVSATSDHSDEDASKAAKGDPMAIAASFQPSLKQIQNCATAARAYSALHGIKFDF